jgi:hypothetical protein
LLFLGVRYRGGLTLLFLAPSIVFGLSRLDPPAIKYLAAPAQCPRLELKACAILSESFPLLPNSLNLFAEVGYEPPLERVPVPATNCSLSCLDRSLQLGHDVYLGMVAIGSEVCLVLDIVAAGAFLRTDSIPFLAEAWTCKPRTWR